MSNEGKSHNGFWVVSKLSIVLILTMIPSEIVIWILTSAVLVDGTVRGLTFLLSASCFLVGSILSVFFKPTKERAILWGSGFIVATGILLISWFLFLIILVLAHPVETLLCSTVLGSVVVYIYLTYFSPKESKIPTAPNTQTSEVFSFSRLPLSNQLFVGGFELKEIPENHLQLVADEPSPPRRYKKFLDVLRGLTLADIPLALRIERVANKTRVFYLTWAKQESFLAERIVRLEDSLRGSLSGMRFIPCPQFKGISLQEGQKRAVSYLSGEPLSIENDGQEEDALTVTAKVLQSMPNGIIQISATPKRSNSRQLKKLEEKYRVEVQRSEQVVSVPRTGLFSGDTQESTTRVDSQAQRKAISLRKQIDRLSNSHLCEMQVSIMCWDSDRARAEENSRRLTSTLRGNLAPADNEHALSIETHSKIGVTAQLLRGEPVGRATLLSLGEAIIYFIIPFCDLGIPVVDHATFRSNPVDLRPPTTEAKQTKRRRRRVLKIGKVLDDSGRIIGDFELPIDDLTSHSGIFGDTGSGKTMTQIKILLELVSKGINFLVLLSSKSEDYVRLKRVVKNLRIFTLGDSTVAPARFCLTNFHPGVHVSLIINSIKTAFIAAKPTDGMVKEYLETLIEITFRRLGWDRDTNTRGLPIVMRDFLETLPLMDKKLQYSLRGNEDFQGAIYGRISSFFCGAISSVFGTTSGLSIEELVQRPTLILVDKLSKDEYSFVMFWLINNLVLHFEAIKKTEEIQRAGLKYYVVLEEAHRFLMGAKGVKVEEEHGAQQAAIEVISLAMQEARSSGLGFSLATQKPAQLNSQASDMAMNVIMHRKNAKHDRQLLGSQMNCNDEQISMIGSLPTGQAVVRTASSSKPVRVQIDNPLSSHPELASERHVSDAEIEIAMRPVFEANPHFQMSPQFTKAEPELESLSGTLASIQLDMPGIIRLYQFINFLYLKGYQSGIEKAAKNKSFMPVSLIIRNIARVAVPVDSSLVFYCLHLVWFFTKTEDSWADDVIDEVFSTLATILAARKEDLCHDLSILHERVCFEATERLKLNPAKPESLEATLKLAVKAAMDEYREMPLVSDNPNSKKPAPETAPSQPIDTIVQSDEFREQYLKRLENASKGNLAHLLRFIHLLAKRITHSTIDEVEVAMLFLHRAREIHGVPNDESLWVRICEVLETTAMDEGTESAA